MPIKKTPKKTTAAKKAAPAGARKRAVSDPRSITNPFDKGTPRYAVAALLLKKGITSWEELAEAAGGTLSPRTMGAVVVALESLGARFAKTRSPEWGICYEYDSSAPLIGNHDGADATGNHKPRTVAAKKTPKKTTAAKKTPKRSTGKATSAGKKAPRRTTTRRKS